MQQQQFMVTCCLTYYKSRSLFPSTKQTHHYSKARKQTQHYHYLCQHNNASWWICWCIFIILLTMIILKKQQIEEKKKAPSLYNCRQKQSDNCQCDIVKAVSKYVFTDKLNSMQTTYPSQSGQNINVLEVTFTGSNFWCNYGFWAMMRSTLPVS